MAISKTLSILGCGWLGLPLAEALVSEGYEVKGSTTTPTKLDVLATIGIKPFLVDLSGETASPELNSFLSSEGLIVAFPPGLRSGHGTKYLSQIKFLSEALTTSRVQHILFISSTSVYPDVNKILTEADSAPADPENILLQAEQLLASIPDKQTTILRFGGLVGGSRQPGRFLAGKQNVANPTAPVNLIHLDDCVQIITSIIRQNKWGEIFNACADKHPTREIFYTAAARKLNLPVPQFAPADTEKGYKIISSDKLKKELPYRFIHPDPMLFIQEPTLL